MSRSEYIKHMTNLPPPLGPRSIKWVKDLLEVDYKPPKDKRGRPVCQCPMVMLGMIEPFPELCICSAHVGASFIEAYTQKPAARAELIGSIHSGLPSCRYRVYLKPSTAPTKRKWRGIVHGLALGVRRKHDRQQREIRHRNRCFVWHRL